MAAFPAIRFRITSGSNKLGDGAPGVTAPSLPVGEDPFPTIAAAVDVAAAWIWLSVVAAASTACRTAGSSPWRVATAVLNPFIASVDVPPAAAAAFP